MQGRPGEADEARLDRLQKNPLDWTIGGAWGHFEFPEAALDSVHPGHKGMRGWSREWFSDVGAYDSGDIGEDAIPLRLKCRANERNEDRKRKIWAA